VISEINYKLIMKSTAEYMNPKLSKIQELALIRLEETTYLDMEK
jgi:hypothetical protein